MILAREVGVGGEGEGRREVVGVFAGVGEENMRAGGTQPGSRFEVL